MIGANPPDVVLRVSGNGMDLQDLKSTAEALGMGELLRRALSGLTPED